MEHVMTQNDEDLGKIVSTILHKGITRRPLTTLEAVTGALGGYLGSAYLFGQGELFPTVICLTVGAPATIPFGIAGGIAGGSIGNSIDHRTGISTYLDKRDNKTY